MTYSTNMEQQIVDLQTRVAFQEDTLQQLNQVLADQDKIIAELQTQIRELSTKYLDLAYDVEQRSSAPTGERPPHY